jgi:hypothetical protein
MVASVLQLIAQPFRGVFHFAIHNIASKVQTYQTASPLDFLLYPTHILA